MRLDGLSVSSERVVTSLGTANALEEEDCDAVGAAEDDAAEEHPGAASLILAGAAAGGTCVAAASARGLAAAGAVKAVKKAKESSEVAKNAVKASPTCTSVPSRRNSGGSAGLKVRRVST